MSRGVQNTGHSVFARLQNAARSHGEDFNLTLTRYAVERFLYRLSISPHASQYALKGATLFLVWFDQPYRPTRDADLLGFGQPEPEHIVSVFREICASASESEDGIIFLPKTVRAAEIRENQQYDGVRVMLEATLHGARVPVQVDIGFGDAVVPGLEETTFPTILPDMPAPVLRTYPRYAVVAEKLEAMIRLGIANSRMKDFYDVWLLSRLFDFDGLTLCQAIRATLERRNTKAPDKPPLALRTEFSDDNSKRAQWRAFVSRSQPRDAPTELDMVVAEIATFLLPALEAASTGTDLTFHWTAGGPWA